MRRIMTARATTILCEPGNEHPPYLSDARRAIELAVGCEAIGFSFRGTELNTIVEIRAGVGGVNWHLRPYLANAPFRLAAHQIIPHPELYGMALFAQMVGPGARLVNLRLSRAPSLALKAWATRSQTGVRLLLINKGPVAGNVLLGSGYPAGTAVVSRLSAPSAGSTTGVTLGGRSIGTDARWHGSPVTAPVLPSDGQRRVLVPGDSAAMVSFSGS